LTPTPPHPKPSNFKMQTIHIPNPNPRTSPAGFSGSFNAENRGWSGSGRVTVGGPDRNVFVQGDINGGWSGRPSVGGMVGGTIRF
jgi:hypothetical protein